MTKAVVFDRWEQDYGDKGPRWASRKGQGWFTASNLIVYDNGAIGPRPGLKAYTLTSAPNGAIRGMDYQPTDKLLFAIAGSVYRFDPTDMTSQAVVTASGSITDTSAPLEFGSYINDVTYFTVRGDKSYRWTASTDTVTAITGSPGGRCIGRWNDRYYVGDTGGGTEERVRYSNAAGFGTWDALDFFDVDYQFNVYALLPGSSRLIIHSDQNLWVLTGTVGSTSVLRRTLRESGRGVFQNPQAVVNIGDQFWFVTAYDYGIGWSNGSVYDVERYEMITLGESGRIFSSFGGPTCLAVGDSNDKGLFWYNDVWTQWQFGVDVNSKVTRWADRYYAIAKDGDGSTPPTFYCLDTKLDRPGFTSDTYANVGDDSSTPEDMYLHTSEYWADNGAGLTVREVKIDFVKWNTGSASTNHFDVNVRALSLYDTEGSRDSGTLSFDEAGSGATTDGEDARWNGTFGDQGSGGGFQIRLSNIRGCAIRAITVIYDESPGRAR